MKIGNLYFSFTNPSLSMLLTLALVLLLVHFVTKNGGGNLVPNACNPWSSKSMTSSQPGKRAIGGMIPYSFTVTSHFLVTLGLSFSIFIGITIVGFREERASFLKLLATLLLELISYCFRALSLGIRLFANMMAGHSLVKILSGFAWTMLCMNDLLFFIGDLGPLFIVLALTGLELGVAISQAYVSTILICIYLNDAIYLHQVSNFIYRPSTLICLFPSQ
ncbi:hypothetical protein MKW92_006044 [Papaver armeniacum]|nr:hypothetical protein MKW92_006044 [Papaver armeniacum]